MTFLTMIVFTVAKIVHTMCNIWQQYHFCYSDWLLDINVNTCLIAINAS